MKPGHSKTHVHLWASMLRVTSKTSRLPEDIGARGASSFNVSSRTGAPLALSISGILGGGALPRRPSNTAGVLASCPLLAGGVGSSSVLPSLPGTFSWCLLWYCPCRRAPQASGTSRTGAFSQRLRPVPRPVVLHIPALNRTNATDRRLFWCYRPQRTILIVGHWWEWLERSNGRTQE